MSATLASTDPVLLDFAEAVGVDGPVAIEGGRTRWMLGGGPSPHTRLLRAPTGIVEHSPEEMTVRVRAGTPVAELHAELAGCGQRTPLPERGGTVGGALVVGENHPGLLGRGLVRTSVLQVRYVSAEGRIVNGGGPTVKNVTGFDLPRLIVGSLGTLGLLAEVILRTDPVPAASLWLVSDEADPFVVRQSLLRPGAVLWNGSRTWVLLEGHRPDIAAQHAALASHGFTEYVDDTASDGVLSGWPSGWPALPPFRWSLAPAELRGLGATLGRPTPHRGVRRGGRRRTRVRRIPAARAFDRARGAGAERSAEAELRPVRTAQSRSRSGGALMDLALDADQLNTCVQCGLCLSACPTYRVTGDETMSPRGRIALMRQVQHHGAPLTTEVVDSFTTCIQCRGCEPACPSGVPYGRLIEQTRVTLAARGVTTPWWQRLAFAPLGRPRMLRAGSAALAVAQRLRLVPRRFGLSARLPLRRAPHVSSGRDVYLFTGCVMDAWQRDVHRAAQRVLEAAGFGVTPTGDVAPCCGALHAHAGLTDQTRRLARQMIDRLDPDVPVIVDSAGCGAAMKDYGHLLGTESAHAFAGRVHDVHEFLAPHIDRIAHVEPLDLRVAVQDPCHLRHVQRVHGATRTVLAPFVREVVELDDDGLCCGAGGAYSVLQPLLAAEVRGRKLESIRRAAPDIVASANPGCSMHLAAAGTATVHPMELVDRALRQGSDPSGGVDVTPAGV